MRAFFDEAGATVRVLCFVRSPYAMSCSDGQEWIKTGRHYRVVHRQSMPAVERLRAVFPDTEIFPFREATTHDHGPVGFLLHHIGFTGLGDINPIRRNESLSDQAARLIAHINAIEPTYLRGVKSPLREERDTKPLWSITGDRFLFLRREFTEIEASVQRENTQMRSDLGAQFCDDEFPTRNVPAVWTPDMLAHCIDVLPQLSPIVAFLTLTYFVAHDLAEPETLQKMRSVIATPDHEDARQILAPQLLRTAKRFERQSAGYSGRLRHVAQLSLVD